MKVCELQVCVITATLGNFSVCRMLITFDACDTADDIVSVYVCNTSRRFKRSHY